MCYFKLLSSTHLVDLELSYVISSMHDLMLCIVCATVYCTNDEAVMLLQLSIS